MMPRSFLVKTAERETHDLMTSADHHHHHQQQQQQQHAQNISRFSPLTSFDQATMDDLMTTYEQSPGRRLQSYLYQLMWTAVMASNNTMLQHRLPVTSSYQLPPLDDAQVSVSSQQNSKFNPFINSPPLTADVDTNRLYPRMNGNYRVKTVAEATAAGFNAPEVDILTSSCCNQPSSTGRQLADVISLSSVQFSDDKTLTGCTTSYHYPLSCLINDTSVVPPSPARFRCVACQKSYSTVGGLSKHREFHCRALDTSRSRRAQQTGAGVGLSSSADGGLATATKDQRCPQCDKAYTSASALKMHIRTHTLPCRCRLCGKAFSRPWLLQGHVRTHTGEKPFSCAHCQRAFADRSNLRAHLQTHYDVKQYHCDVCRRTFSRMSLLLKHRYSACTRVADTANDENS